MSMISMDARIMPDENLEESSKRFAQSFFCINLLKSLDCKPENGLPEGCLENLESLDMILEKIENELPSVYYFKFADLIERGFPTKRGIMENIGEYLKNNLGDQAANLLSEDYPRLVWNVVKDCRRVIERIKTREPIPLYEGRVFLGLVEEIRAESGF